MISSVHGTAASISLLESKQLRLLARPAQREGFTCCCQPTMLTFIAIKPLGIWTLMGKLVSGSNPVLPRSRSTDPSLLQRASLGKQIHYAVQKPGIIVNVAMVC